MYTIVQSEREGSARGVKIRGDGRGTGECGRDGAGVPRVDPSSSFIIKVIDYREPLDEGILRCGERRSKAVFLSPAESSARTHIGTPTGMPRSRELTGDHCHVDRCRGTLH